jgi:hypothetical protein
MKRNVLNYFFRFVVQQHSAMSHVVDLENASTKLTGLMTCVNDTVKELGKCKMCKEHILSLIQKASRLLDAKEEILTAQLKSLQEFRGKKREGLFDEEGEKRARRELDQDLDAHLGASFQDLH